jgi:hypothetical protein
MDAVCAHRISHRNESASMATAQPREISPLTLLGATPSGRVDVRLGFSQVAGQVFSSIDGARLLLYATPFGDVYYAQVGERGIIPINKGKIFVQSYNAYRVDINEGGVAYHVNINLAGSKTVISNFLDIFMGCLAVAGGPVAYAITGMNVLVAGGKLKRNYALYTEALEAFVSDDMALRHMMPVFYDHMYAELFLGRIEADLKDKAKDLVKGAIPAPKAVKGLIGVFLGKVGEDPMKRMLNGIRGIIVDVLLKSIDRVAETGQPLTADQIQKLASYHIGPMYAKLSQVPMRQDRAEAILREATGNGAKTRPRLLKIANAVDALTG